MIRFFAPSFAFLFSLFCSNLFAQQNSVPNQSISLQPILWLDNVIPRDLVGLSAQYEHGIRSNQSAVVRGFWFRNPLLGSGFESGGAGISGEYRFYFSESVQGWHLGPFVEGIGYKWLGISRKFYGGEVTYLLDVGTQVGHKWTSGHVSFDLSVRTALFLLDKYPSCRLFPQHGGNDFASHLLISMGYAF